MQLKHLHLQVSDVESFANFLITYFGMSTRWGEWGSDRIHQNFTVLFDESGFVLTLMKAKNGKIISNLEGFHIGFPQENKHQVDQLYERLKRDGFELTPPQQLHAYTFYIEAPGGVTIEVLF